MLPCCRVGLALVQVSVLLIAALLLESATVWQFWGYPSLRARLHMREQHESPEEDICKGGRRNSH